MLSAACWGQRAGSQSQDVGMAFAFLTLVRKDRYCIFFSSILFEWVTMEERMTHRLCVFFRRGGYRILCFAPMGCYRIFRFWSFPSSAHEGGETNASFRWLFQTGGSRILCSFRSAAIARFFAVFLKVLLRGA